MIFNAISLRRFTGKLLAGLGKVCTVTVFLACINGHAFSQADIHSVAKDVLDSRMVTMMETMRIPGASVAVLSDNRIVYYNTFGVRMQGKSKTPMHFFPWAATPDSSYIGKPINKQTIFNGASLSKIFLAAVVYQMIDEKKLEIDRPLYEYMSYEPLTYDERYKKITTRMVLSHTSGLENWQFQNNPKKIEIVSEPGTAFVYSGEGYMFLTKVVEKMLGKSYEIFTKERIIDRLALKDTYLKYNKQARKDSVLNHAIAHTLNGAQYAIQNYDVAPAYGVHFTAYDFARLMQYIFADGLSPSVRRIITQPGLRIGSSEVFTSPGFYYAVADGDTLVSFGGDNPGYKSFVVYSITHNKGFVVMTNSDLGKAMTQEISRVVAPVNIQPFLDPAFNFSYSVQFPDESLILLTTYFDRGQEALSQQIDVWANGGRLKENTLNKVAYFIYAHADDDLAIALLERSIVLFPKSAITHALLGEYYLEKNLYKSSAAHLKEAQKLGFRYWDLDKFLIESSSKLTAE